VADDLSPSIVFIDEIDAIGSKRYDSSSGENKAYYETNDVMNMCHSYS
jgi:26S proteasome regulatory subunit T2